MRNIRSVPVPRNDTRMYRLRGAFGGAVALALSACASAGPRIPVGTAPDVVTGSPVTSVALLGALHPSDSVRSVADSALATGLRKACPAATVLAPDETERRLAARAVIVPRQLSSTFARDARAALNVDLLLAPTALGLTYDTRNTVAGVMDAVARPAEYMFDDKAGMALEGWDLRTAERTVRVVRTHSSERSWTAGPGKLLQNATGDAVRRLAVLCAPATSATARPEPAAPPRN